MVVTVVRREPRDIVAIELQAEVTSSAVGTLVPFSYNRSRPLYLGQRQKHQLSSKIEGGSVDKLTYCKVPKLLNIPRVHLQSLPVELFEGYLMYPAATLFRPC